MDVAEEPELTLQRISPDLLAEFGSLLPGFLWTEPKPEGHSGGASQGDKQQPHISRQLVKESKADKLVRLLEPFQEWPQLLDPHLSTFLPQLSAAFVDHIHRYRVHHHVSRSTIPLPRAISMILYTLCKIRGEKTICRFLDNMPYNLAPFMEVLEMRTLPEHVLHSGQDSWKETYIMLLWLSHLLLMPFDLLSLMPAKLGDDHVDANVHIGLRPNAPVAIGRIINIGACYLRSASLEREAARRVLVRLALRPDMRSFNILDSLINWADSTLFPVSVDGNPKPIYEYIGALSILNGLVASADNDEIAPYLGPLAEKMQDITAKLSPFSRDILSTGIARKLIIKVLRSIMLQAIQVHYNSIQPASLGHLTEMIETIFDQVLEQMLEFLADKDAQVRYAASKALSMIAVKLEPPQAAQIVDIIIKALDQDLFWDADVLHGITLQSDIDELAPAMPRRNLTAVDSLRWHGLVLTLSHLIYRQSPAVDDLADMLNSLILALNFEQRTSAGASIGTGVRDAACFGLWSLARRYTTKELLEVDISRIYSPSGRGHQGSTLQIISNEVIVAAMLDPAGNIRRGASAALQEMIGRHPDTIVKGIDVVQTVDYHAVALRSKAMLEVAINASRIDDSYRRAIIHGLLGWRGLGSVDAQSRRFAANSIGILAASRTVSDMKLSLVQVRKKLIDLPPCQTSERHGLLLSLAAIINECGRKEPGGTHHGFFSAHGFLLCELWDTLSLMNPIMDDEFTLSHLKPDLTAESSCAFISALALATSDIRSSAWHNPRPESMASCIKMLNLSLHRTVEQTITISSNTARDLFSILDEQERVALVNDWIASLAATRPGQPSGHIAALGTVLPYLPPSHDELALSVPRTIITTLLSLIRPSVAVELRVAAVKSLSFGVFTCNSMTLSIVEVLRSCLNDFTVDQRGDVGSHVRLEAIDTAGVAIQNDLLLLKTRRSLLAEVVRLAVEKFDKVRFRAWSCVQKNWDLLKGDENPLKDSIVDVNSTATSTYFEHMLTLYSLDWLRSSLLEGYVSAAGAGADSLLRSSRLALVIHIEQFSTTELVDLCHCFNGIVEQNLSNDRVLIPTLVVLGFVFDSGVFEQLREVDSGWRHLCSLVQKSHVKSRNIQKLRAAVRLYTGLGRMKVVRDRVLAKLCAMLLHPFAIIRNDSADALFLLSGNEDLRRVNWSAIPTELKRLVPGIQERLKMCP